MADADDRRDIIVELERAVSQEVGKLQLRVLQALTFATPKDTGYAQSAWTPSSGRPGPSGPDKPPSHTHKDPNDPRWRAVRAAASARIAKNLRVSQDLVRSYQLRNGPVYISNNVPYIGVLNGGSSSQAPKRFVEAAVETAVRASG